VLGFLKMRGGMQAPALIEKTAKNPYLGIKNQKTG
jgi:hypothetical protein